MNAYLAAKFYADAKNKKLIEEISESLEKAGFNITLLIRDYEKWGKVKFPPKKLMEIAFKLIDKSDLLIIEFSEKGVGLGIEAGYGYAKNIPIIVIAKKGSDISNTLQGIAKRVIFYDRPEDLIKKFEEEQL